MSDVENETSNTEPGSEIIERASPEMHELTSRGIILDALNNDGETALMISAKRGKMKLVNNLLELGASDKILTPEGESALTLAEASGNHEVAKLLR